MAAILPTRGVLCLMCGGVAESASPLRTEVQVGRLSTGACRTPSRTTRQDTQTGGGWSLRAALESHPTPERRRLGRRVK
jgi:hypothetical protein